MIRSMTGYASVRETIEDALVSVEVKTLNHRSFDFHYHSSRSLSILEIPVREYIQKMIKRGRVDLFFRSNKPLCATEQIEPNHDVVQQYIDAGKSIAEAFSIPYDARVEDIMTLNGVLDSTENQTSPEESWALVQSMVESAIQATLEMKINEGKRLETELRSLLQQLEDCNKTIINKRDDVIEEYREKLLTRITEWKEQLSIDENKILQEVAFFCDRSDIQEETVRLTSHIEQFIETLDENQENTDYKPIGRRLDFICQEMFRETNTIGSKSSSIDIVKTVIDMKRLVEQIREQVQNVE